MPERILTIAGLDAFYGDFQALYGVDMTVAQGEVLAIIGANGAGKTTLLRSISGLIRNEAAQIRFRDRAIGAERPDMVARMGLAMVPEGPPLRYELFPILEERRHQASTSLSGGQQQMVAIGRALMSNPDLIMFDEISLGLAPVIIRDIYAALAGIVGGGMSAIIVEQDITKALSVSSRVYCLQEGRVSLEGRSDSISREEITRAYFGVA